MHLEGTNTLVVREYRHRLACGKIPQAYGVHVGRSLDTPLPQPSERVQWAHESALCVHVPNGSRCIPAGANENSECWAQTKSVRAGKVSRPCSDTYLLRDGSVATSVLE